MTLTSSPIRAGLIGYGYAGKTFHAPLINVIPGLELTTIASSKPEQVHATYPHISVHADPFEVATSPSLDLIVIATPNETHFPLAAAALKAGKHVVVDKPFTLTFAEAKELVRLSRQYDRLLSVFHNRRWDSEVLATKAVLASGVLGRVTHYESHMDRFRPNIRHRWREDPGPGGGLWFDLGPHLIDQTIHLFGLPESVLASLATLRTEGQTDDWAHVQLIYPHLRVILNATLLSSGGMPRTIIHGTQASWVKFGADVQEAQLIRGIPPDAEGFGDDPDPGILYEGVTAEQTKIPAPPANQSAYYASIRDAILGLTPNPVPPESALAVMAILEASFNSAAQGKILPIPLTPEERSNFQQHEPGFR
jgi:predicted dehydrogenase